MATVRYCISKIEKASGKKVEVSENGLYSITHNREVIQFRANGGRNGGNPLDALAVCIKSRRENDHDDAMTDYSSGVYCSSIKQAITLARWN